jgi:hypothetical protein
MRDTKKYIYLTIGILRDSQTHKDLLADAQEHNTKHLPTVAGIRLGDYYGMRREGIAKVGAPVPAQSNEEHASYTNVALSNAVAASDEWGD